MDHRAGPSLHWSTAVAAVVAVAVPVLWAVRTRQLDQLRAEVSEVRSYASEIERGLRLADPDTQAVEQRRRHLWLAHGARCAALITVAGIGFEVASGVLGA